MSEPNPSPESSGRPADVPKQPRYNSAPEDVQLLSADEIARLGSVCRRTVWGWISLGELPAVKIGRCTRVRLSDWRRFLAARSNS